MSLAGHLKALAAGALAMLAALCASASEDSLPESLAYLSEQVHAGYVHQRLLLPELPPYLSTLFETVRTLYPDTPLRLFLMRLADGNASALPDGGVYLRQGFLARIHDREELIFVLAHEAAHVALEHVAGRCRDDSRLGLFSVEVEVEADREAMLRMRRAGLPSAGVRGLLQRLAGEGAAPDSELGVRINRIAPQAAAATGPPSAQLIALQREALRLLLSLDRDRAVAEYLETLGHRLEPAERLLIEAELARRRNERERAEALFRDAIEAAPLTVAAWRGLALTLEANGERGESRAAWQRVLELEPGAMDAPLVRAFIAQSCDATRHEAPAQGARSFWELDPPAPWQIIRSGPRGFVASPDSVELTRLRIDPEGPAQNCPLSLVLFERVLRQLRARPGGPVLSLESVRPVAAGALARLSYGDEAGVNWRLDLYAISNSSSQFEARFRAPAVHFYPRWAADAATLVDDLSRGSTGPAAR